MVKQTELIFKINKSKNLCAENVSITILKVVQEKVFMGKYEQLWS